MQQCCLQKGFTQPTRGLYGPTTVERDHVTKHRHHPGLETSHSTGSSRAFWQPMCVDSRVAGGTCSCSLIRVTNCAPWSSTVSFHRLLSSSQSSWSICNHQSGSFTINNNYWDTHSIFINQVSSKECQEKENPRLFPLGKKRLRSAIVKPFYLTQWFSNGGNFASREHDANVWRLYN